METEVMKSKDTSRCKKCGSNQTHFRLKTSEKVCHKCGHIEKLEEKQNG